MRPNGALAQVEYGDDDYAEVADTLVADTLLSDSAIVVNDTLPWPQKAQAAIDELLKADMFQTSQVGLMVWDLDADSAIYAYNERQLLRPASVMKVITAVAALDRLGGSYMLKTELWHTGSQDSTTLNGDLYCVGGFDPVFGRDDMRAFVSSVKRMGIDTIRGNIYADRSMKDTSLLGEGWCWDDDNPILSPLIYQRKDNFTEEFRKELEREGVVLVGNIGVRRCPMEAERVTSRFHTISQVLNRMMTRSDNLFAESVYYQLAASTGKRPASARDARAEERKLVRKLGLNPSNYKFADGSGLSLYNYVSAELIVRVLRYAYDNKNIYDYLLPSLPIAGVDGTLKDRLHGDDTRYNVRAKTGTLTGITSLAGYLTADNGHHICFVIINQGLLSSRKGRQFQDKVCQALCK